MESETSLIARQIRLQQWADDIRECNSRPAGVTVKQWCCEHGLTKATYYWRLRAVRTACLDTMRNTADVPDTGDVSEIPEKAEFVEMPMNPVAKQHVAAVIHIGPADIEIPENLSDEMLLRIMKAVAHAE